MRNDEKETAVGANDYRTWPTWSDGDPILENTKDAETYGELMWPDDYAYKKTQKLLRKEKKRVARFMERHPAPFYMKQRSNQYSQLLEAACKAYISRENDYNR